MQHDIRPGGDVLEGGHGMEPQLISPSNRKWFKKANKQPGAKRGGGRQRRADNAPIYRSRTPPPDIGMDSLDDIETITDMPFYLETHSTPSSSSSPSPSVIVSPDVGHPNTRKWFKKPNIPLKRSRVRNSGGSDIVGGSMGSGIGGGGGEHINTSPTKGEQEQLQQQGHAEEHDRTEDVTSISSASSSLSSSSPSASPSGSSSSLISTDPEILQINKKWFKKPNNPLKWRKSMGPQGHMQGQSLIQGEAQITQQQHHQGQLHVGQEEPSIQHQLSDSGGGLGAMADDMHTNKKWFKMGRGKQRGVAKMGQTSHKVDELAHTSNITTATTITTKGKEKEKEKEKEKGKEKEKEFFDPEHGSCGGEDDRSRKHLREVDRDASSSQLFYNVMKTGTSKLALPQDPHVGVLIINIVEAKELPRNLKGEYFTVSPLFVKSAD